MKAVMTPMGISWGATMVRASRSPRTMKEAPNSTPTGSERRWSDPTSSRTMWGTTSPTKPITPLTATDTPAISEVTRSRLRRSRWTSTPSEEAASAPIARALRDRA